MRRQKKENDGSKSSTWPPHLKLIGAGEVRLLKFDIVSNCVMSAFALCDGRQAKDT
ncbi:MAG: hypothetical protein ONB44_08995 [candidate division KSB1 bacterium]|nr:hypothetical protein [candidate division KSB1 bacterium]MDZ7302267.1 hypothetical protein [candidate division KSB1 bacterium]MDZ7311373.1 hypothetical protein [candidate division KSB1 bacterium]